jgi:hypothetical protein
MSIYFALGNDGRMYNLCDCGDFEAAEESADDVLPPGVGAVWIFDADTAREFANVLLTGLTMNSKLKLGAIEVEGEDRFEVRVNDLYDVRVIKTDEGVVVDVFPEASLAVFEPLATTYAFDTDATF